TLPRTGKRTRTPLACPLPWLPPRPRAARCSPSCRLPPPAGIKDCPVFPSARRARLVSGLWKCLSRTDENSRPVMPLLPILDLGPGTLDALAILAAAIGIAGIAILILFSKGHV